MAALSRFDRNYELTINGLVIKPPIRVAFSCDKTGGSGGRNRLTIKIYNLKESNRLALAKDKETQKYIPVSFSVGYDGALQLLFKGDVLSGKNYREGPEFITEIDALDGGYDLKNSFTSKTIKTDAVNGLLDDFSNISKGKITKRQPLTRPRVLVGSTVKLLNEVMADGETWFIDNEELYVLKQNEVVSSFVPVVDASTGLLNTPVREQSKVSFSTLLNPTLRIAGLCYLKSKTAPHVNGIYKIENIGYSGDNYGSDWSQTVVGVVAANYKVV